MTGMRQAINGAGSTDASKEFANQKALIDYAEQNGLAYEYEYTPAFAKRHRLLPPEQYEIC
jgi:hypothetical protein